MQDVQYVERSVAWGDTGGGTQERVVVGEGLRHRPSCSEVRFGGRRSE